MSLRVKFVCPDLTTSFLRQISRVILRQTASYINSNLNTRHKPSATMALPLQAGLTPMEVAFLCEMEMVTVVPRQRLESLNLLSVGSPKFYPTKHSPSPHLFSILLFHIFGANISFPGPNSRPPPTTPRSLASLARTSPQAPTKSQHPPTTLAPASLPRKNPETRNRDLSPRFLTSTTASSPDNHPNLTNRPHLSTIPPLVHRRRTA